MIQDNNIESLQDAAKQYQENQDSHFIFPNDKSAFKAGATWQKEQYKDLIQSHAELLESLKTMYDSCRPEDVTKNKVSNGINLGEFYVGGCGTPSAKSIHKAKTAIEKANSIINQQK